MKKFYVYILSSKRNGTLYIGVTSDLIKRVYEHKDNVVDGFSKKYNIHHLVWYEAHETVDGAIIREADKEVEQAMEVKTYRER